MSGIPSAVIQCQFKREDYYSNEIHTNHDIIAQTMLLLVHSNTFQL